MTSETFYEDLQKFVNKYDGQYIDNFVEANYNTINGENISEYLIVLKFIKYNNDFQNDLDLFLHNNEFYKNNESYFKIRQEFEPYKAPSYAETSTCFIASKIIGILFCLTAFCFLIL